MMQLHRGGCGGHGGGSQGPAGFVFKASDGYITAHHLGFQMAGLLPGIGDPELAGDPRLRHLAALGHATARINKMGSISPGIAPPNGWSASMLPTFPCGADPAPQRNHPNEQVVAPISSWSSINQWSDGCGSRNRRPVRNQ